MRRIIDDYLKEWHKNQQHKPIVLRGARQVGKTTAVRKLAKLFDSFVEINFEFTTAAIVFFEADLDPERIIIDLSLLTKQTIIPGKTLLFFDEVQACPRALIALRYFYEQMPELHVIAAGSLLEFAIEQVGVPVGRVNFLYVYPMSFLEFMWALGEERLMQAVAEHDMTQAFAMPLHEKLLRYLSIYIAIGGMPEVVYAWIQQQNYSACLDIQHSLIASYEDDFYKYATKKQIKYLQHVYSQLPHQVSNEFRFSKLAGEYRRRELEPAFELLKKAYIVSTITHSSGNGLPLGAEVNPNRIKIIMLDIGLTQAMLGLSAEQWILDPHKTFINKGQIAEAFFGQELLAYSPLSRKTQLYYWQKEKVGSQAEVDYLLARDNMVAPIEIKSGTGGKLKSLNQFLQKNQQIAAGYCFSLRNYQYQHGIYYLPLYAIHSFL